MMEKTRMYIFRNLDPEVSYNFSYPEVADIKKKKKKKKNTLGTQSSKPLYQREDNISNRVLLKYIVPTYNIHKVIGFKKSPGIKWSGNSQRPYKLS